VLVGGADDPPGHRQVEHRPDPLEPPQYPPHRQHAVVVVRSRWALRANEQRVRVLDFVRSLDADHGSRKKNSDANFHGERIMYRTGSDSAP